MIACSWIQFMIHNWIDHLEDTEQVELSVPGEGFASGCPLKTFECFKTKKFQTGSSHTKFGFQNTRTPWWDGSVVYGNIEKGMSRGFFGIKEVEREKSGTDGGDGGGNRRLRPDVSSLLKTEKDMNLNKFLLDLRISGYSLSVNVIQFVYSGLQICDLVKNLISRMHIVEQFTLTCKTRQKHNS
ncbi:unnamed protein product [Vicia faba]|uniref:Uncharacterized protein n=1 Tax=Vicia faba TaxID=3906 RepID=A0AAV0YNV7_VICFA|nr:unnamed protein product [Vicia faba]